MFFAVMRAELERTEFEMFEVRWCWSVLSVKHHAVCCELVLVVLALGRGQSEIGISIVNGGGKEGFSVFTLQHT